MKPTNEKGRQCANTPAQTSNPNPDEGMKMKASNSKAAHRRSFNPREKAALRSVAGNACEECGKSLSHGFHADHKQPHADGGPTTLANGQALCPTCNLRKGRKAGPRPWQSAFIKHAITAIAAGARDYVLGATFGSGKTRAALMLMEQLKAQGAIDLIVIVTPWSHVRDQWASEAEPLGLKLKAVEQSMIFGSVIHDGVGASLDGYVLTAALLCRDTARDAVEILCSRHRVAFVVDEVHHSAEGRAFGDSALAAAGNAVFRLGLSGTPYRDDADPIAFLHYEAKVGLPHFDYSYEQAKADGVVAQIGFRHIGGSITVLDTAVAESPFTTSFDEDLSDDPDRMTKRLGYFLNGRIGFTLDMIRAADAELQRTRADHPAAGGIVFCQRVKQAKRLQQYIIEKLGRKARLVVEDANSTTEVDAFNASTEDWIVSVRKVYEGSNIPRLRVGVYATNVVTESFFAQSWGRLVRWIAGMTAAEQAVTMFIPADPRLIELAARVGVVVRHEITDEEKDDTDWYPSDDDDHETDDDDTMNPRLLEIIDYTAEAAGGTSNRVQFTEEDLQAAKAFFAHKPALLAAMADWLLVEAWRGVKEAA